MADPLDKIRRDFSVDALDERDLPSSPFVLLRAWCDKAVEVGLIDPNAMSLSTIDGDGFPVSRIVLLRGVDESGLRFFTNYQSAKGLEIAAHQKVGLQFFWPELERQVRIRGLTQKLQSSQSDEYFASRPRASQIGAWASPQSQVLASREELDQSVEFQSKRFDEVSSIPRPAHWGGYVVVANQIEFWQGRPSRLHDRLRASLRGDQWFWQRLAP